MIARMKKPAPHSTTPATTVRLPSDLHAEIKYAAGINGNTMNAEIIFRLRGSVSKQIQLVTEQNEKTHELLKIIIGKVGK